MTTLSSWRLAIMAAIALSPCGITQLAQAAPGSVVVPTVPVSSSGEYTPPRTAPSVVVPVYSPGYPSTYPTYPSTYPVTLPSVTTPSQNPVVTSPGRLPPLPGKTPPTVPIGSRPSTTQPTVNGLVYRVVVTNAPDAQQVKTIVPEAFQTSLNGRSVVQAGIFREQSKALDLQQTLNRSNLQSTIVPTQASDLPVNSPPRVTSPAANSGSSSLPAVPKTGIRVVLDPGHGGGDPGAIGIGGLRESDATLDISRQVMNLLKQQGIDATLTRSRDEEIDLEPRVAFAERANADVFVSIHANSFDADRTDVNGIETYYYSGGSGRQLAQLVQTSLIQELGARDRGVQTANFYVIKYTDMPAILVETGFVTGTQDASRLSSASGRGQIAKAIARGILQYINQTISKR